MRKRGWWFLLALPVAFSFAWYLGSRPISRPGRAICQDELLRLSYQLLHRVKMEENADSLLGILATYRVGDLTEALPNDTCRNVFWVNLYNALYQLSAQAHGHNAAGIFSRPAVLFSDASYSLDEIEHGILRRYRWKYGLGYLPGFWPRKSVRALSVSKVDPRIHFALNCGARSCPPILFYEADRWEQQIELATASYLQSEVLVDDARKVVAVPRLLLWFRGDFGDEASLYRLLGQALGRPVEGYEMEFRTYDWGELLHHYKEEAGPL